MGSAGELRELKARNKEGSQSVVDTVNILSLCSGVGMLDEGLGLGLEYLGRRPRVVAYAEREAYAASVLLARMADASLGPAPVWCGNLEDMDADSLRGYVDVICAGFPCQPWSNAGKGEGTDDERWLWPAIADIIERVQPGLVFLENVAGIVSGRGLNHVLNSLAQLRFDAVWTNLKAAAVGAAHERERVFILAYSQHGTGRAQWKFEPRQQGNQSPNNGAVPGETGAAVADAVGGRSERRGVAGNVRCAPGPVEGEGNQRQWRGNTADDCNHEVGNTEHSEARNGSSGEESSTPTRKRRRVLRSADSSGVLAANAKRARSQGERSGKQKRRRELAALCRDWPAFAPGPGSRLWERIVTEDPHLAPAIEPGLCVLVDELAMVVDASRADQLRCGGNGVVALQAAAAFVELMRRAELA